MEHLAMQVFLGQGDKLGNQDQKDKLDNVVLGEILVSQVDMDPKVPKEHR